MHRQEDVDLEITSSVEDARENYVPSSFDDYLVHARMRHRQRSTETKLKLHSDYDQPSIDVILFFLQFTYKALPCIIQLFLTHLFCADRHHQGHRRRRFDPGRGRLLRRGLLLRDRRAHPQRRHRLPRRHLDPHLRDQLLHPPHQDARPVDRPPPLHDTLHRARV